MTLKISVVIPTYNRRESLRLTLDGLSHQTLHASQWEAVVVSDGSIDGTNEFLRKYAEGASYSLRLVLQTNAGPSTARNRGIEQAAGEVIVFVDDDVEPCPEFLEIHLRHHTADPSIAVIGPLLPDPARRRLEPVWIGWEHAMLEKQYKAFRSGEWGAAGPNHFYSGNASVSRDNLLAIGGFDTKFTRQEDVELAYRLTSERSVHYTFDATARAFHRPLRTWESWLKVPFAYGRLDVISSRRSGDHLYQLSRAYEHRNLPTRILARIVLLLPTLSAATLQILRLFATVAYLVGCDGAANAALSAAYNVHYVEGAKSAMTANE